MGKRGPPPTPTKTLKARRSWRAKLRKNEPEPPKAKPRCPTWLRDEAKVTWKRLTPILDHMGLLTTADINILARYCQTYARWREAEEAVAKDGSMVADDDGALTPSPWIKVVERTIEQLLKMEQQFGLTPSARAGWASSKKPSERETDKSRFFKGGAG